MSLASRLTLALLISLSSACSILPQAENAEVYRLPAAVAASSTSAPVSWSLRVNKPLASDIFNVPRIAVVPQGDQISSYKGARWTDPAPTLLRNRILDAFQRDGRVPRLSADDSNLQADYELVGELQALQSEYSAQGISVVIRLDARLVEGRTQRILASRHFEVRQPQADKEIPAVVSGLGQVTDRLMAQLLDWTVAEGNRYQAKNQ
ncbi:MULTISPECIES: ABC-type transport auxiliary lipoprotein family protein [unclassified Pseudomonas]|uniref:ABC-type transport auxiliary lipoprotein family protein n=1 Tax=unclassified Pseudomonas TaxID=196821 RepID=UPI0021CAB925|nr:MULTISPECIES: ABC-type transport auxiliary lipoprotein family protein [unclassified Pseudomonas]MCU1735475.1 ABC-type transport auxiliary lipoprotein family protein [Pseudomonas sp. 20P_3.2_Bac4]MCU1747042.1 ABC-type transport auxiliary lipoprotein family protein [Pseudomonas sp. 20P_3.2_Bac5]